MEPTPGHDNLDVEALSATQVGDFRGFAIHEAPDDEISGPELSDLQNTQSSSLPTDQSHSQPVADWNVPPQDGQQSQDSLFLPSFFEQIMVPIEADPSALSTQQPPDISMLIPDHDDWFTTFDMFDSDFGIAIDLAMDGQADAVPTAQGLFEARNAELATDKAVDSAQRHAILQRSS